MEKDYYYYYYCDDIADTNTSQNSAFLQVWENQNTILNMVYIILAQNIYFYGNTEVGFKKELLLYKHLYI